MVLLDEGDLGQHASERLSLGVQAEVNADDVRVLSIYPGRTATPQQAAILQAEGKNYTPELFMQPEDVARVLVDALKVNRTAEVTDIHIRPMRPCTRFDAIHVMTTTKPSTTK